MEPLDLTMRPPRPCRDQVAAVAFLARNIDKARAALPGGNLGEYFLSAAGTRTLSSLFFQRFGCSEDEFVGTVGAAATDDEVGAWLRARTDEPTVTAWNALIATVRMRDLDERSRETFERIYAGHSWSQDDLLVDVVDAAD